MQSHRELTALLDRMSAVELKVAEIYDLLAQRFEQEPSLARFWALFAEAERYHSLLIQMQKMIVQALPVLPEQLETWGNEIAEAFAFLEDACGRLHGGWKPRVSDAFSLADEIEGRALEIHARSLKFFDQSAVQDLFSQLHEEDLSHRDKLLQARRHFDSSRTPMPGDTGEQV